MNSTVSRGVTSTNRSDFSIARRSHLSAHADAGAPQHFLNFFPLPQGHGWFRPVFPAGYCFAARGSPAGTVGAAQAVARPAPQAVRSAADLPELHVAWCAAIGMGLLTVEGGKASGGPELKSWPPDDGTGLLEAWLKGFFTVSAVLGGGDRDLGRGFLVLVLALLKVLQDEDAPAGRGLLREVLEEADEICDSRDLDADVHGALSGLSSHGMPKIEALTALLADFGITAKADPLRQRHLPSRRQASGWQAAWRRRCAQFRSTRG